MGSFGDVLAKHLVPGLGDIIALAMFVSPLRAVLAAWRSKNLGSLNPLPMVAMWANCVAWLVYAFLTKDPYVLCPNWAGLLLGTFMTMACFGLADDEMRDRMLAAVMMFTSVLSLAGIIISFGSWDPATTTAIWGYTTVFILVVYYSAPLTVLAEVMEKKNSTPLHLPLAAMSCANGSLWTIYGLAVHDAFIWGPNMVGCLFGGLQVLLCMLLPREKVAGSNAPSEHMAPGEEQAGPDLESLLPPAHQSQA